MCDFGGSDPSIGAPSICLSISLMYMVPYIWPPYMYIYIYIERNIYAFASLKAVSAFFTILTQRQGETEGNNHDQNRSCSFWPKIAVFPHFQAICCLKGRQKASLGHIYIYIYIFFFLLLESYFLHPPKALRELGTLPLGELGTVPRLGGAIFSLQFWSQLVFLGDFVFFLIRHLFWVRLFKHPKTLFFESLLFRKI